MKSKRTESREKIAVHAVEDRRFLPGTPRAGSR